MAKTNFSKVEEALNEGLLKMNVANLLDKAALASEVGGPHAHVPPVNARHKQLIAAILFDVHHSKDDDLFAAGRLSRKMLKEKIAKVDQLTDQEWKELETFKEKVDVYKKAKAAKMPVNANDALIEEQRKKHINKRYNVSDKWLPLQ